jgi:hypothetical protein
MDQRLVCFIHGFKVPPGRKFLCGMLPAGFVTYSHRPPDKNPRGKESIRDIDPGE